MSATPAKSAVSSSKEVLHFYRAPGVLAHKAQAVLKAAQAALPAAGITALDTEHCFNVEVDKSTPLSTEQLATLTWLLAETYEAEKTVRASFLAAADSSSSSAAVVEVGPRLSFESAISSNAKSICRASGLSSISRVEVSRRWRVTCGESPAALSTADRATFVALVSDRMTETEYAEPLQSFVVHGAAEPVEVVPVLAKGRAALEDINARRGLGFDEWDLEFYLNLFRDKLKRDPTDVELFDMGNANSEHSRHWFFGGKMVIDGEEQPKTLFRLVKDTIPKDKPSNSIIAFHDNSSAIRGCVAPTLGPEQPGKPSKMVQKHPLHHPILTAETHNFPTGVAPFNGAETGTGGRLRDVMATGRGAHPIAGISSYCVGNLRIPGYALPWEEEAADSEQGWEYASNLAKPLDIAISASDGASDYGNKFGEPVVHGFTRSFGQRLANGERCEYVKPIMFSAGIGQMNDLHTTKGEPEVGMWVVKVGGPAYRIGLGGGAASSRVGDAGTANLDFDAVQRGDAEMENRLNRLMRACVELDDKNPIISLHDQGAGGNGNVLKEIVDPAGAKYDIRNIIVGDETMSVLEIWGSEYQENNALLIRPESTELFLAMAKRENCPCALLGQVSGDGRLTVIDTRDGTVPYDLPLKEVLGDLPQKTFEDTRVKNQHTPLQLPADLTSQAALDRVLRLLSVGSKRFLTNKVDRSVTGLVAQQQCVGPLQTPLANCAVVAQGHQGITGIATACGEQPIKGIVSPAAMARMTVAEALTNLMWARVSSIDDIKASGNWMWASKLPGECARMYDACSALREALLACGVGIDGGKDSLSMAARCGSELVKSPGTLVMTLYVQCPDIRLTVTPDLKLNTAKSLGKLLYVDLGGGKARLGGTALAQVFNQVGDESPDVEDFAPLVAAFKVTQTLLDKKLISAGHDRSDGGLATCLLEMAFAGNCGITVDVPAAAGGASPIDTLFSEEAGFVLEVAAEVQEQVVAAYTAAGVAVHAIGSVTSDAAISIAVDGQPAITGQCGELRAIWEATSFQLERLQCNPECVDQEEASLKVRPGPQYKLTYTPEPTAPELLQDSATKPRVCVLRQEGSNGDREMLAAFHAAGFEAWDVNMMDMLEGGFKLDERFQGVVFVGGFSYADVLDSAKGWAATIKFNPQVYEQFTAFRARKDTFSLGVCNGCQLMALLGWVPAGEAGSADAIAEDIQPRFVHNKSGRYESRWSTVKIGDSPAVMFKGMEGTSMGIWVAHGEGQALFPDSSILQRVTDRKLAALRFVDDSNAATEEYPYNPNGSPQGIAGLCSEDGRHLAMMPHPERCFTTWQWPYMPTEWKSELTVSPWLRMFQNAREWCVSHQKQ